jgi:hypothetical protein
MSVFMQGAKGGASHSSKTPMCHTEFKNDSSRSIKMTAHEKSLLTKAERWVLKSVANAPEAISPRVLQNTAPTEVRSAVRSAVVGLVASGKVMLEPNQKIAAKAAAKVAVKAKPRVGVSHRSGRVATK